MSRAPFLVAPLDAAHDRTAFLPLTLFLPLATVNRVPKNGHQSL